MQPGDGPRIYDGGYPQQSMRYFSNNASSNIGGSGGTLPQAIGCTNVTTEAYVKHESEDTF